MFQEKFIAQEGWYAGFVCRGHQVDVRSQRGKISFQCGRIAIDAGVVEQVVEGEPSAGFDHPQGFGYDPLFVPDRVGKPDGTTVENTARRSYAELADDEKDAISHRGRAMEKLSAELPAFLGHA